MDERKLGVTRRVSGHTQRPQSALTGPALRDDYQRGHDRDHATGWDQLPEGDAQAISDWKDAWTAPDRAT